MNSKVTILTHFSVPTWPIVNKLRGICRCLDVEMIHCPSLEELHKVLNQTFEGRVLFFTDEGLIDVVKDIDERKRHLRIEVALFMRSPIQQVAKSISDLGSVKYLIGVESAESYGRDLSILIKKFAVGDILDLSKYLAFGCKINTHRIDSSAAKAEAVASVGRYIAGLGDPGYLHPFEEYARRVSELVDELLLNAVFDANPRLLNADRSQPFQLNDNEIINVSWGFDGDYFGVSVRDPFGRFASETIMRYMSVKKQADGVVTSKSAGLGLKLIFEKAHQVIANIQKERVTEVIALLRIENRMLEFDRRKKSFYYFVDQTDEGTTVSDDEDQQRKAS